MTDREIIIHLAEKVMGWKAEKYGPSGEVTAWQDEHKCLIARSWNPLENIADAFQVQAAFLYLWPNKRRRFTQSLNRIAWNENSPGFGRDWAMVGATARQRCLAIVEATK